MTFHSVNGIYQNPTVLLSDTATVVFCKGRHRAKLNRVLPIIGKITLHAASQEWCKILVGVNAQGIHIKQTLH